ncbi:hypothetical protein BS78_10G040300 [Paspalum vaginatum]|uniref:Uncharacterized protein n=1 Tax=Paspalum vaginatum TaxID=158149 RepID=A0A9W7X6W5_9POAL|nr:hypothetical protein BS78_K077400 [Paspalum vaginatum]KAJ1258003.1 hypothetical protein BS78_10G040300 [Paspalum vaginatum]
MASSAPWLLVVGLFLTGNSLMAIRRSRGDAATVSFVVASYVGLIILFYCLRWFEAAQPGSASRGRARVGVWLTTTVLTAMFSWRVALIMPSPVVAAAVCVIGASTAAGGFYTMFLLPRAA